MMERVQSMSPEEREEFFTRMRARRSEAVVDPATRRGDQVRRLNAQTGPMVPTVDRGASTIDALFAPVEIVETNGRVWIVNRGHLSSVDVTLGVTDGTASELLGVRQPTVTMPPGPAVNQQVNALRQQLASIDDVSTRAKLEAELAALHFKAEVPMQTDNAPAPLGTGTKLVTNVSTLDTGIDAGSGNSGSPLIPQFPFGRRRR